MTNWEPAAFNPDTGLFYVAEDDSYSVFYLLDPDPRGSMGLGGKLEAHIGTAASYLTALDYKTGKAVWREEYPSANGGSGGGGGLLTTAGGLVFGGDAGGNIVAHDAKTGKPIWHARIGNVSNAPTTYLLDGRQYLLVAAGDMLYSFTLYQ
jgi:alcohol dehydrogenase (cytochrome c)